MCVYVSGKYTQKRPLAQDKSTMCGELSVHSNRPHSTTARSKRSVPSSPLNSLVGLFTSLNSITIMYM